MWYVNVTMLSNMLSCLACQHFDQVTSGNNSYNDVLCKMKHLKQIDKWKVKFLLWRFWNNHYNGGILGCQ